MEVDIVNLADLVAVMTVNYDVVPDDYRLAATLIDYTLLQTAVLIVCQRRNKVSKLVINFENPRVHGIQSLLSKSQEIDFNISKSGNQ